MTCKVLSICNLNTRASLLWFTNLKLRNGKYSTPSDFWRNLTYNSCGTSLRPSYNHHYIVVYSLRATTSEQVLVYYIRPAYRLSNSFHGRPCPHISSAHCQPHPEWRFQNLRGHPLRVQAISLKVVEKTTSADHFCA